MPEIGAARHAEELRYDGAAAAILLVEAPQQVLQLLPRDPDLHLLHRRSSFLLLLRHRALLGAMHGVDAATAMRCVETVAHLELEFLARRAIDWICKAEIRPGLIKKSVQFGFDDRVLAGLDGSGGSTAKATVLGEIYRRGGWREIERGRRRLRGTV